LLMHFSVQNEFIKVRSSLKSSILALETYFLFSILMFNTVRVANESFESDFRNFLYRKRV